MASKGKSVDAAEQSAPREKVGPDACEFRAGPEKCDAAGDAAGCSSPSCSALEYDGDQERLRAKGFAFGGSDWLAMLGLAAERLVQGPLLLLGERTARDRILLSALAAYRGTVILVDHTDLTRRLTRDIVYRFAPGAAHAIRHDPLGCIRSGVNAWHDLCVLAGALVGEEHAESVAAILGDHRLTAAPEEAGLVSLRRRLMDVDGVVRALHHGYGAPPEEARPLCFELERVKRSWAIHPQKAKAAVQSLTQALCGLADGRLAESVGALDCDLAQLLTKEGPTTLAIAPSLGAASDAAPILAALVTQAVDAVLRDIQQNDTHERVALIFPDIGVFAPPPHILRLWRDFARCGVDILVGAATSDEVYAAIGGHPGVHLSDGKGMFSSVACIGPVAAKDAEALSCRVGEVWALERADFALGPVCLPGMSWRERPRLAAHRLERASRNTVWLIGNDAAPRKLCVPNPPPPASVNAIPIAPASPQWTLAPLERGGQTAHRSHTEYATASPPSPTTPRAASDVRTALQSRTARARRMPPS